MFGLVKQLFLKKADDPSLRVPKIIIMSATLDSGKFSEFFGNCPVCEVEGRMYPVDVFYRNAYSSDDLKKSTPSYISKVRQYAALH